METERFYQRCLKEELAQRLQRNPRYSLRSFARSLEIDASTLSRILSGQKIPTPAISKKIVECLSLSPKKEREFFHSMAKAYEETGVQRKKPEVKAILNKAHPIYQEQDLTSEIFRAISEWYYYAILQLVQSEAFQSDPRWIAKQLGIQEMEAKLAISRLKKLKLLDEKNGRLFRATGRLTTGDLRITTPALRGRIKQVTGKSIYSLENDPIALRNHTTRTISIDPDKIPVAKRKIQTFMDQLCEELQTKKKKVYELQVNLFPLQRIE